MHLWGWVLFGVCIGLFLGAEILSWRADRQRNPERRAIKSQPVTFRLDRATVHHAQVDGRDEARGFKGFALVVHEHGLELSHFVPGYFMLVPDWYRNIDDVAIDIVGRPGSEQLRLTLRSGVGYDKIWFTLSADDRASAWRAIAAIGEKAGPTTSTS